MVGLFWVVVKDVPTIFVFDSKEFYWVTSSFCWDVVASVSIGGSCVVIEEYVSFDVTWKVVCLPSVDTLEFFS
jgi:hypothetical protein